MEIKGRGNKRRYLRLFYRINIFFIIIAYIFIYIRYVMIVQYQLNNDINEITLRSKLLSTKLAF